MIWGGGDFVCHEIFCEGRTTLSCVFIASCARSIKYRAYISVVELGIIALIGFIGRDLCSFCAVASIQIHY